MDTPKWAVEATILPDGRVLPILRLASEGEENALLDYGGCIIKTDIFGDEMAAERYYKDCRSR